jgi:hypothetical protein
MNLTNSLKAGMKSGYRHHWKVMTLVSVLVFIGMVLAFMKGWYLLAVGLSLWFLMVLVQWITIDPPDVTDKDVHGPGAGGR